MAIKRPYTVMLPSCREIEMSADEEKLYASRAQTKRLTEMGLTTLSKSTRTINRHAYGIVRSNNTSDTHRITQITFSPDLPSWWENVDASYRS